MRNIYIIGLVAILFSIVSCSGTGMMDTDSSLDEEGITKVGNPDVPEPAPTEAQLKTKKLLEADASWFGDCNGSAVCGDRQYLIQFDVGIASIVDADQTVYLEAAYAVSDDGSVSLDVDGFKLQVALVEDHLDVQMEIEEFNAELDLNSVDSDDETFFLFFTEPKLMCEESENNCSDFDNFFGLDLLQYKTKGRVYTTEKGGETCGKVIYDSCVEEGALLAEVTCLSNGGHGIQYVKCDCQDGRCIGNEAQVVIYAPLPMGPIGPKSDTDHEELKDYLPPAFPTVPSE